jgi:hypothetical protein
LYCGPEKFAFYAYAYIIHAVYVYKTALETGAHAVFIVWLWAWPKCACAKNEVNVALTDQKNISINVGMFTNI